MTITEGRGSADLIADGGTAGSVAKERYLSRRFHELEARHLWPKVWQLACRESEIPDPGDSFEYNVVDESILVVRTADGGVRAYFNTCPHRGQRLRQGCSSGATIQCPFHAWTWDLDGGLKSVPSRWDFPDVTDEAYALRQCRAETWGGFVFVNMDLDAEPLADFLETIPERHAHLNLEQLVPVFWLEVVVRANWKLAVDAFSEAYHIVGQHPQMLFYFDDVNTTYEVFGSHGHAHHSTLIGNPSPHLGDSIDANGSFEAMVQAGVLDFIKEGFAALGHAGDGGEAEPPELADLSVPDGMTARDFLLQLRRQSLAEKGVDVDTLTDGEIIDADQYHVFPNAFLTASISGAQVIRARPHRDDHESCLFDFILLAEPPPGLPNGLPKQSFDTEEAAMEHLRQAYGDNFALAFEQDIMAMPVLHQSMKSSSFKALTLAGAQEVGIANRHRWIDSYIQEGQG